MATVVLACALPLITHAATAPDALLGKILIDTGRHGEAWYVNPQSRMKVELGRPADALSRLKDRAVYVGFVNIARLAERDGEKTDAAYAKKVSGGHTDLPDSYSALRSISIVSIILFLS